MRRWHGEDKGTLLQMQQLQPALRPPRQEESTVEGEVRESVGGAAAVLNKPDAEGGETLF